MKLLLTSSSFKGGGIASYAVELVASYSKNFEMSVIIGDDSLYPLDKWNVAVYHFDMQDTSEQNAQNVLNLINQTIKPDVVINSCSRLMPLIIPFLRNNIKVINVSHSLRYNEADYAGLNSEYVDNVIALSDFNKNYLENNFNCKGKVTVVYNFVGTAKNQSSILHNKLNARIPVIVFSGGGTAAKAPELIYQIVMNLLKTNLNFKFYWMGTTTPPFKKIQPFKEISDILPDDSRLIITGRISREEAIRITNEANIFLTPSRREGCPVALLEAMRIGTIPITSDYDNACKEIVQDGYNGFVISHNNINEFVDRIVDIIKNPERYTSIYENSVSTFKNELSFTAWKKKMDALVLNSNINHIKRLGNMNLNKFRSYKKQLEKRSKYNLFHLILFEYLPSALPFLKFYLKYKFF